jgi:hypothetical protein
MLIYFVVAGVHIMFNAPAVAYLNKHIIAGPAVTGFPAISGIVDAGVPASVVGGILILGYPAVASFFFIIADVPTVAWRPCCCWSP